MATSREWSRIAPSGLPAREMSGSGRRNRTQTAKVALLVGAGDAIGAAVARRFARGGFAVCIARREAAKSQALVEDIRSEGGEARAYSTDTRKEENVKALFAEVERGVGPIEVCLFNAGSNVSKPLLDNSEKLLFNDSRLAPHPALPFR